LGLLSFFKKSELHSSLQSRVESAYSQQILDGGCQVFGDTFLQYTARSLDKAGFQDAFCPPSNVLVHASRQLSA